MWFVENVRNEHVPFIDQQISHRLPRRDGLRLVDVFESLSPRTSSR